MFSRQFVRIDTSGPDEEACLLFDERGALVAVLVRLSEQHSRELVGKWFLEHGFGAMETSEHPVFASIDDAETWAEAVRRP